ncbi:MAG: BLUF domain-containing protein [Armatimonadetes bacterium]|nr:BLUF domain-containing protein [Armatimonadota bacterium]
MSRIAYLVYASTATEPFTSNALFHLLKRSRVANEKRNVTGALLYKNGVFVQLLEGAAEDIEDLREKIYRDPRHTGVVTLMRGFADDRVFKGWTMHFIVADGRDAQTRDANYRCLRGTAEDGTTAQDDLRAVPSDELHPGLRLLLTFRQVM